MLRHRSQHGLTWDFNYTFSKSIDMTSDAERVSLFEGSFFGTGELYNPFNPGAFRAVSDYDMRHQINSNWVYELPFGREKKWGSNWNRGLQAVIGGWMWSGLGKWTSGLPFSVQNGFQFPTNWELNGVANLVGPKPKTGAFTDALGRPGKPYSDARIAWGHALTRGTEWRVAESNEDGPRWTSRGPREWRRPNQFLVRAIPEPRPLPYDER